jgi:hypothetical protein
MGMKMTLQVKGFRVIEAAVGFLTSMGFQRTFREFAWSSDFVHIEQTFFCVLKSFVFSKALAVFSNRFHLPFCLHHKPQVQLVLLILFPPSFPCIRQNWKKITQNKHNKNAPQKLNNLVMHIARLSQDNCESGRYWNRKMGVYVFFD